MNLTAGWRVCKFNGVVISDKSVERREEKRGKIINKGGVAKWLRQGPAKPLSVVRFHSPPPRFQFYANDHVKHPEYEL